MVTSSAVVGSSAMMSLGLQASPIAIITRWRMPPESWCGYCSSRRSPSVMPTSRRSSSARSRACASLIFRWMNSGSMICSPIDRTGLSEVIGSWKIIEMSRPRISRISSSESSSRSRPSNRMRPGRHLAGGLGQEPHDGERGHRLAAAGLADDGDDFAAVDGVGNAVDRAHDAARRVELDVQVLHLEQRRIRSVLRTAAPATFPPWTLASRTLLVLWLWLYPIGPRPATRAFRKRGRWAQSPRSYPHGPPSGFADLPQNLGGMLAEPRGGAFGRHRRPVDHDRGAHARNRAVLGGGARRVDLHAAVQHLRIGEHLVERVDRPGRNSDRLELGQQVVAPEGRRSGADRRSISAVRLASRQVLSL